MKKLGKKLILNKKTIDILDEKALQNVKGGLEDKLEAGGQTCLFWSCAGGGGTVPAPAPGGGGQTCLLWSCAG